MSLALGSTSIPASTQNLLALSPTALLWVPSLDSHKPWTALYVHFPCCWVLCLPDDSAEEEVGVSPRLGQLGSGPSLSLKCPVGSVEGEMEFSRQVRDVWKGS